MQDEDGNKFGCPPGKGYTYQDMKDMLNNIHKLEYDNDIANVDPKFLIETINKVNHKDADAVFISCTALRAVEVLDQIEEQISKYVISSNQAMIWDCLRSVNINNNISGYGKLLSN